MSRMSNLTAFFFIWSCGFCYAGRFNKYFLCDFNMKKEKDVLVLESSLMCFNLKFKCSSKVHMGWSLGKTRPAGETDQVSLQGYHSLC